MIKSLMILVLLAIASVSHAADYYGDGSCTSSVTSAQEAANKADWIMEGTVDLIFLRGGSKFPTDVTVGDARMVHERDPRKIGKSMTLEIGPCIAGGRKTFQQRGKEQMEGKRFRFYGVRHVVSPLRRIFFMESVDMPMPVVLNGTSQFITRPHPNLGEKQFDDGWRRVRSTEGGFAVDLPGEVMDGTKANGDAPAFVLRSSDHLGSIFMAVFERSGRDAKMHGTYDQEIEKATPEQIVNFRGYPAFMAKSTLLNDRTVVTRSLFVRVPGGTYMLSIATPKEVEAESSKNWERFYNSLSFN